MKKLILPLIFILLLTFVSCQSEAPNGYQIAYVEGEPFKLYVPSAWIVNIDSGVSGAYIDSNSKIMVTAWHYTPEDAEMTLEEYMTYCNDSYNLSLKEYKLVSLDPSLLSGFNAKTLVYTRVSGGMTFKCMQITAKHSGHMISFNYYSPESMYDTYFSEIESIIKEFVVTGTVDYPSGEFTDKDTPDGMKIASGKDLSFRLYVPKSWHTNTNANDNTAKFIVSGIVMANVSVTSYSPDKNMSLEEYSEFCNTEFKANVPGYEFIEKSEITFAGRPAMSMTYRTSADGIIYRIMQVSVSYDEIVYTITYTAAEEDFEVALADAEKIIAEFAFR